MSAAGEYSANRVSVVEGASVEGATSRAASIHIHKYIYIYIYIYICSAYGIARHYRNLGYTYTRGRDSSYTSVQHIQQVRFNPTRPASGIPLPLCVYTIIQYIQYASRGAALTLHG